MGAEIVGSARSDAQTVREERLRRKLHRELGPVVLEALADEKTIEVMVNPDGRVWWDRLGDGQSLLPDEFSAERAESLVGTVAALLDTVANQEHPIVEGELPFFGFRFEGIVPPVAPRATAAIRKHSSQVRTLDDYVTEQRLSPFHADVLRAAIGDRFNIIVTGGTASGKTTFVNALLQEKVKLAHPNHRFVILEDTVELRCAAPNRVALRTSDVADHANSARAALSRLDQLVQEAGVPSQPFLLADAVDLVVSLQERTVREVLRVRGFDPTRGFELEELAPSTTRSEGTP
jgi:type IV secretion system protein VirB11